MWNEALRIATAIAAILATYTLRYVRLGLARRRDHYPHPYKTIDVDPSVIEWYGGRFTNNPFRYGGTFSLAYYAGATVRGGDWDLETVPVNELRKYSAVVDRYERGIPWEETNIYEHILELAERKGSYDGCTTKADVVRRYREIDELYQQIRDDGYRTDDGLDQVCVNIGRNGDVIFNGNGNHRLFIAKVLGLDEIPVRVLVRHEDWMTRRRKLVEGEFDGTPPADTKWGTDHPDLDDVVVAENISS
ncbi:hypothetical protein EA472_07285 [Natrarchaeobius oligotrophus]|uniref:ParB/Sulfiredoxin domain-containing protein n=1 Tax=Natrarchaeobius chitinivorans TaxID=1679083 RepID=A0A3N6MBT1_NATCH|nr:hypothetical protein EA472_07285 [Natrarchaeobius chitinivorans]